MCAHALLDGIGGVGDEESRFKRMKFGHLNGNFIVQDGDLVIKFPGRKGFPTPGLDFKGKVSKELPFPIACSLFT